MYQYPLLVLLFHACMKFFTYLGKHIMQEMTANLTNSGTSHRKWKYKRLEVYDKLMSNSITNNFQRSTHVCAEFWTPGKSLTCFRNERRLATDFPAIVASSSSCFCSSCFMDLICFNMNACSFTPITSALLAPFNNAKPYIQPPPLTVQEQIEPLRLQIWWSKLHNYLENCKQLQELLHNAVASLHGENLVFLPRCWEFMRWNLAKYGLICHARNVSKKVPQIWIFLQIKLSPLLVRASLEEGIGPIVSWNWRVLSSKLLKNLAK